jgi:helicase MOV-10
MQLLIRDANFKILACTPSNAAADVLVERLAAAGLTVDQLLRLNALSRDIKSIPKGVQPFSASPTRATLRNYRVVLSTCSSAARLHGRRLKLRAGHFSHIIIDEAGQVDEPLALVPISLFSNEDTNIILAGDPNQLGPVIKSSPASEAGLGKSYLERLMLISEIYGLNTQDNNTLVFFFHTARLWSLTRGTQDRRPSAESSLAWCNHRMAESVLVRGHHAR